MKHPTKKNRQKAVVKIVTSETKVGYLHLAPNFPLGAECARCLLLG